MKGLGRRQSPAWTERKRLSLSGRGFRSKKDVVLEGEERLERNAQVLRLLTLCYDVHRLLPDCVKVAVLLSRPPLEILDPHSSSTDKCLGRLVVDARKGRDFAQELVQYGRGNGRFGERYRRSIGQDDRLVKRANGKNRMGQRLRLRKAFRLVPRSGSVRIAKRRCSSFRMRVSRILVSGANRPLCAPNSNPFVTTNRTTLLILSSPNKA